MKNIKTKWIVKLISLLLLISLSSCDDWGNDCIRANNNVVSELREVPFFNSVVLNGDYDVEITYGNDFFIEVEAPSNVVGYIETEVRDQTLNIISYQCINSRKKIKVYLTVPVIESLWVKGSGDITSTNVLVADRLFLYLDGSGDIDVELDVLDLEASIMGSGDMDLYGIVDNQFITVNGSGDLQAFNLESLNSEVEVRGSGNVEVRAVDELDVLIRGSGSVYYKGRPNLKFSITGSGALINAN